MLRQCFECDTGILFNAHALAEQGLDVETMYPVYQHLKKPVVGPSPKIMEKWEAGKLAPISRRSTALAVLDEKLEEKRHSEEEEKYKEEEEDEMLQEWVPEQVEDYFDSMASINDQVSRIL
jgi:hypothetical protein